MSLFVLFCVLFFFFVVSALFLWMLEFVVPVRVCCIINAGFWSFRCIEHDVVWKKLKQQQPPPQPPQAQTPLKTSGDLLPPGASPMSIALGLGAPPSSHSVDSARAPRAAEGSGERQGWRTGWRLFYRFFWRMYIYIYMSVHESWLFFGVLSLVNMEYRGGGHAKLQLVFWGKQWVNIIKP